MLNRLILKVTKFQLPPPKRLGTVAKNILGGHHAPPCQIGLNLEFLSNLTPTLAEHLTTKGLSRDNDRTIEIHFVTKCSSHIKTKSDKVSLVSVP